MSMLISAEQLFKRTYGKDYASRLVLLHRAAAVDPAIDLNAGAWQSLDSILVPNYSLLLLRLFANAGSATLGFSIIVWPRPSDEGTGKGAAGRILYKGNVATGDVGIAANIDPVTGEGDAADSWFEVVSSSLPDFTVGTKGVAGYPEPVDEKPGFAKAFLIDLAGSYAFAVHFHAVPGIAQAAVQLIS